MPATRSTPNTPTTRRQTARPGPSTPSTARRSTTQPPPSPANSTAKKENDTAASPYPPVPPEEEHLWDVIYTDGACSNNGKGVSALAGIGVWSAEDEARRLSERCPGEQTNNRAELLAIIRALEETPYGGKQLLIKTDSTYAISCMYQWISNWDRKGWLTAQGKPVKNQPLLKYLARLLELRRLRHHTVRLQHIRGHNGTPGNEAADALARAGALLPWRDEEDWDNKAARVQDEIDGELLAGGDVDGGPDSPRKRKRGGEREVVLLMSPRKRAKEDEEAELDAVKEDQEEEQEQEQEDEFGDVDAGWMDDVPEEELAKLDSSPAKRLPLPLRTQSLRRADSSGSASEFDDADDPFADLTAEQLDALDRPPVAAEV